MNTDPRLNKSHFVKTFFVAFLIPVLPIAAVMSLYIFFYTKDFWVIMFVYALLYSFLWCGTILHGIFHNFVLSMVFYQLGGHGFELTNRDVVAYGIICIYFLIFLIPSFIRQRKNNIEQEFLPAPFIKFFIGLVYIICFFIMNPSYNSSLHLYDFLPTVPLFTLIKNPDAMHYVSLLVSLLFLSITPVIYILYYSLRKKVHQVFAYDLYGFFLLSTIIISLISGDFLLLSFGGIISLIFCLLFFAPRLWFAFNTIKNYTPR